MDCPQHKFKLTLVGPPKLAVLPEKPHVLLLFPQTYANSSLVLEYLAQGAHSKKHIARQWTDPLTDKTGRSTQKSLPKVCANFALREETLMEKNPPGANGEPGPFKQTQK